MQQRISHRQVRSLRPRRNRRGWMGWMDAEDWNMCLVSWWQDILEFWHLPEFVYGTMTYFTGPVYILVHILIITCLIILWDVEINPTACTWHVLYLYCHLTSPHVIHAISLRLTLVSKQGPSLHLPSLVFESRVCKCFYCTILSVDIFTHLKYWKISKIVVGSRCYAAVVVNI